jgi:hypothetical protein
MGCYAAIFPQWSDATACSLRSLFGTVCEPRLRVLARCSRQIERKRALQGRFALVPLLQLLVAPAEIKLELGIVATDARSLVQELDRLSISPAPEVQDAEGLGEFGVIRIGLARFCGDLKGLRLIGRPPGVKEGEFAERGCKRRIRIDGLSIGVNGLIGQAVPRLEAGEAGERCRVFRLLPQEGFQCRACVRGRILCI